MATVDLGKVAVRPMGEWSSATTYEALDAVHYSGAGGYVALVSNTNVTPGTDATKWALLVEDGTIGKSAIKTRIDHTSSETSVTGLAWDTLHVWPEMASLTFTLGTAPSDGYEHQITIVFDTPADLTNFNLGVPSTMLWGNNINLANNLSASTRYEVNINSGSLIALYTEAALATS